LSHEAALCSHFLSYKIKKFMSERIRFLNTAIDDLSMEETVGKVAEAVREDRQIHHTVVNAGKIVSLQRDLQLRESVNKSDIINADGQAVVWASRILGIPLKERVAGIDLFIHLLDWAYYNKVKVYLLGAEPKVIKEMADRLSLKYSHELIAGYHHGYFKKEEEKEIVENIVNSGAHFLFVAMSSPRKEIFLYRYRKKLTKLNFIMGVGGSFDVLAGKVKRAPVWMQKSGFEWFYRFLQEPKRMWKRYLIGNIKFIFLVIREKWRNRHQRKEKYKIKASAPF